MLSKETKKKIDDARDILVGQLPLPSDQVELITIALIYKFMDDQDEDLRQLGFNEAFFSGDLKQYSWQRLMSNEIDADERVSTFTKGIEEIQKAPHIPQLFREIFKNTFLKFRDGRTLHLFLKVINGFSYDHSEELGNAFEYLLMSMGAQGENGQFRTPRNIIDFIVEVVDPDKGDTILDPACGTGGFLLSAYKHILRKYTTDREHYRITLNNEEIEGIPVNWGDKLTSQDLKQLGVGIEGYDITPQMTRLAKVNLYLHQFKIPRIHEYDTLTSDGRWKDKYDCILANPPFMTPKGGVSTHSKFRIRASKAEVLFSDYILEHLTPDGMAGFIVPEGIIFQNSDDYVELRKWLVNGAGLWAVVSLPAQIFQPYSGVKTSILFIDRKVARGRDEIILVKVESDGYSLNTNRAATARNDLPEALNLLTIGKKSLDELRGYLEKNSGKQDMPKALIKPRKEFARLDAYKAQSSAFNLIRKQYEKCLALEEEMKLLPPSDQVGLNEKEKKTRTRLQGNLNKLAAEFSKTTGSAYTKILLPLQSFFDNNLKEAVIVYGADNAKVGGLSSHLRDYLDGLREYNLNGERYREEVASTTDYKMIPVGKVMKDAVKTIDPRNTPDEVFELWSIPAYDNRRPEILCGYEIGSQKKAVFPGDVLLSKIIPHIRRAWVVPEIYTQRRQLASTEWIVFSNDEVEPEFLRSVIVSDSFHASFMKTITGVGGSLSRANPTAVGEIQIPLPPLEIQKQIVTEIEAYQKVVDGCDLIIENYKPTFEINVDWPVVELGTICNIKSGGTPSRYNPGYWNGEIPWVTTTLINFQPITEANEFITKGGLQNSSTRVIPSGTLLMAMYGQGITRGKVGLLQIDAAINQACAAFFLKNDLIITNYLYRILQSRYLHLREISDARGGNQSNLSAEILKNYQIPLPPLETQQKIVAELEEDLATVDGAKRLKAKMEANIRATISRVWGETA